MRVYRYDPAACGVPDNGIRCVAPWAEPTTDPEAADVFVIPCLPSALGTGREQADRMRAAFPYLASHPARHFCVEFVERIPPPEIPGMCYVRTCGTPECLAAYPTMVAGSWWVGNGQLGADLGQRLDEAAQSHHFTHRAAFVGWRSTETCQTACASIRAHFGDLAIVEQFPDFHGHRAADDETRRREFLFTEAMRAAPFQLAPSSIPGVLRYRVFEALRASRIPVIIDGPIVWPRADRVDWSRIAIHVSPEEAKNIGPILGQWLAEHSEGELIARCQEARLAWLRAFDGRRSDEHYAEIARDHIVGRVGRRD